MQSPLSVLSDGFGLKSKHQGMDAGGIGTLVVLEVQPENPIKKQYDVRSPEFDSSRAERIRGTPQRPAGRILQFLQQRENKEEEDASVLHDERALSEPDVAGGEASV